MTDPMVLQRNWRLTRRGTGDLGFAFDPGPLLCQPLPVALERLLKFALQPLRRFNVFVAKKGGVLKGATKERASACDRRARANFRTQAENTSTGSFVPFTNNRECSIKTPNSGNEVT